MQPFGRCYARPMPTLLTPPTLEVVLQGLHDSEIRRGIQNEPPAGGHHRMDRLQGDQPRINAFQRSLHKSALPVMSRTRSSTKSKAILKPTYKTAATKRSPIKDKTHGVRRSNAMRPPLLRSTLIFVGRSTNAKSGDLTKSSMSCRQKCRSSSGSPDHSEVNLNWIKFDHAGVESLRKPIYSFARRGKGRRFLIVRHQIRSQ